MSPGASGGLTSLRPAEATAIGTSLAAGTRAAIWICLGIAASGGLTAAALFALGGARLQTPDLKRWNEGEPAWASPALLARTRHPQQQAPPRAREAESVRR
jgi:hypothetical protein